MEMSITESRRRHRLARVLATFALAVGAFVAGDARAESGIPAGGGANNVVLAQTFADEATLVRSNTQVSQTGGPSVQSSNIASAIATGCTACYPTAVAVQVVLVTGEAQYFLPANAAVAFNAGCIACGSFAYAWQYVVQTDRPVTLSPEAYRQIQILKQQIADTAASIVPDTLEDDLLLQAALDDVTGQLKELVDSQIQAAGAHGVGTPIAHVDRAQA
jgi:hypothetical protein